MNFYQLDKVRIGKCTALFLRVFNNPPWNENWRAETVAQRIDDCYNTPGFYGLGVEIEGQIVGFAIGYKESWDANAHFYLKEMCVAPEHQRCGVGTALMNELQERLKAEKVEKIYLHTARDTAAQAFYEKQGFYVSPKMILMAKWLQPKKD